VAQQHLALDGPHEVERAMTLRGRFGRRVRIADDDERRRGRGRPARRQERRIERDPRISNRDVRLSGLNLLNGALEQVGGDRIVFFRQPLAEHVRLDRIRASNDDAWA
jgi:hypothetical protein